MAFEPVFESINCNCERGEILEQIKAETKTDVPLEQIKKVLSVNAFATTEEGMVGDGKLDYSGRVVFFLSYVSINGEIRKAECGAEFKGMMKSDLLSDGARVFTTATVDKIDTDLSGVKLSLSAYVTVRAEVEKCRQVKALVGGEDVFVKSQEITYSKGLGLKVGVYPVEEQFDLNYAVKEVLAHKIKAFITAVQCGVGTLIVDGEVLLSIIVLQNKEKGGIIRENRTIPFRMELECDEAMPTMQAIARVKERAFKTDVSVDEESGQSTVTLTAQLQFYGEAFSISKINVASDAFCKQNQLELEREDFFYSKSCELHGVSSSISGRAFVDELPVGASLLAVGGEKVEVVSKECDNGHLKLTGVLTATAYFTDGEGNYFTRKAETPFDIKEEFGGGCNSESSVRVGAINARARVLSLTEIELEAEIRATLCLKDNAVVGIVKEIKTKEQKEKCDSALSVYIPFEGEDLWSLAKRLNEDPDKLIETNKDLTFPLTGKERIVVYRRK